MIRHLFYYPAIVDYKMYVLSYHNRLEMLECEVSWLKHDTEANYLIRDLSER